MDDLGVFRTTIEVQNWELRGPSRLLPATLVDTGSEYTWIPRPVLDELGMRAQRTQAFEVADGRRIERDIGYALVRAAGMEAPDLIVRGVERPSHIAGTLPRSHQLGIIPKPIADHLVQQAELPADVRALCFAGPSELASPRLRA